MKNNKPHNRAAVNHRRRARINPLLALICACASFAGLLSAPRAFAQTGIINDPPVAPHLITVFPERDFVSAEGYDAAAGVVTISVIRAGNLVSQAHVTPDRFGLVEVNHPGGGCWENVTPDIRPGDIVRVTTAAGVSDQTTVANVVAGLPVQVDATTVQVHGSAQDAAGSPLPLAQIEQRLLNPDRFDNGRRTLRAPGDGTLAYDAAGSVNWTATYTNLSAADMAKALDSESRILWLGRDPLAGTESTIFEIGADVFGGPQAPCTAPSENGQSAQPVATTVPPAPAYTTLNDPPAAPHIVGAFPERDFVSAEGYTPGQLVTINVLRKLTTNVVNADGTTTAQVSFVTVGAAQNVPANSSGIVEVNHIGGACWEGQTPDIRPGDIVRATTATGIADQTTVANVISSGPIQINTNTVVLHGSAVDAAGNPLPIAQLDTRLVGSSSDPFDLSARRDLRAPGNGTLAFDAPGSTNFTVTYTGLTAADITRIMDAESRTVWTGRDPVAGNESTTFETGPAIFAGPQAPCTMPQEPRLSVSATPASTATSLGTSLSVTLTASETGAAIFYTTNGTTPTTTSTRYVGPITLTAKTILKFMAVDTANALTSQTFMEAYEFVDRTPPAAPSVPDLATASDTGSSSTDNITRNTALTFNGTAEAGSTVKLFVDGVQVASGTATGGAYSLTANSVAVGTRSVTATATDAAGNISAASAALSVTVDTTNAGVTANPAGGTYASAVSVTLSSETGAAIYYTTNGTTPTTASTRYTAAISISANTTLKALSVDVAGNQSVVMSQTYTIGGTAPAAPSNLTLTAPIQGRVTLSWKDNSTNETSFVIERSLSSTSGFTQIGTVTTNTVTFNDNTVARRTTYFYRVKAVNGAGSSAYSNVPSIRSL
ncbi:MAG TPA: chitobiase/beta-hexosaminidase C-terminal domain-containing protein [Pyrinomonadaceae bacterium]